MAFPAQTAEGAIVHIVKKEMVGNDVEQYTDADGRIFTLDVNGKLVQQVDIPASEGDEVETTPEEAVQLLLDAGYTAEQIEALTAATPDSNSDTVEQPAADETPEPEEQPETGPFVQGGRTDEEPPPPTDIDSENPPSPDETPEPEAAPDATTAPTAVALPEGYEGTPPGETLPAGGWYTTTGPDAA